MTGSAPNGEPQAMTLEEALAEAGRRGYSMSYSNRRYRMYDSAGRQIGTGVGWADLCSRMFALGYSVVERDDTAELIEALLEWAEAKRKYDDGHYDSEDDWSGVRPSHDEAYRRLERAEAKLTTLGALHHAEAALAAYEASRK